MWDFSRHVLTPPIINLTSNRGSSKPIGTLKMLIIRSIQDQCGLSVILRLMVSPSHPPWNHDVRISIRPSWQQTAKALPVKFGTITQPHLEAKNLLCLIGRLSRLVTSSEWRVVYTRPMMRNLTNFHHFPSSPCDGRPLPSSQFPALSVFILITNLVDLQGRIFWMTSSDLNSKSCVLSS